MIGNADTQLVREEEQEPDSIFFIVAPVTAVLPFWRTSVIRRKQSGEDKQ